MALLNNIFFEDTKTKVFKYKRRYLKQIKER